VSDFSGGWYDEADALTAGLPETIGELIDLQAARLGDRPFLRFGDAVTTYAQLPAEVNRVANGLARLGIQHGDRVAIMSANRPEFAFAWMAAARLGALQVPVNAAFRGRFLSYALNNSRSSVLIIESALVEHLALVATELSSLRHVLVLDDADPPALGGLQVLPWGSALHGASTDAPVPSQPIAASDTAAIAYTSGTTGASKGVMLSHGYFCLTGRDAVKYRGLRPGETIYTCLPLFHMNAQTLTTMPALTAGATLALDARFSASGFWTTLARYGADQFNVIGAMLGILWRRPPSPAEREHRAHTAFGGPIAPEILAGAAERWGIGFVEGFGSTESGLVAYQPRGAFRAGSFGKAIPEFEVELFDEHDRPVPDGTPGEIVTRPRRPNSMMTAYYGMPEKTVEAWRNLWFHTGDMGRRDADGYLYFVDRKKDAIRRRGENISSAELEQALLEHDAVVDAAVIAVASELGEDEVKACVVADGALDHEAFLAWCEQRLPRFMIPRYVEVLGALPKTPTQRTEKYRLREDALNTRTWDRERGGFVDPA